MRTRYTNLNEYKLKVREGIDLPTYIRTLLDENNYWANLSKQETQINEEATAKNPKNKNNSNSINLSQHNESSSESNTSSMQNSFEQQQLEANNCNQPIQLLHENAFKTFSDENYTNLIQSRKFMG